MNRSTFPMIALAALAISSGAAIASEIADKQPLNLDVWRRMLVHHRGRIKPLDTAARESILGMAGRIEFRPEAFETISPIEIKDWVAIKEQLQAPPTDAPRAEESQGRSDRFKSAEAGSTIPITRVRELITPGLRRQLRDTDIGKDDELLRKLEEMKSQLLAKRKDIFARRPEFYMLHELRKEAAKKNDKDLLEHFARYDQIEAEWRGIRQVKFNLITELNAIISFAQFFDNTYWMGVSLSEEAKTLIAEKPAQLPPHKLARLNRLLIAHAFPKELAPPGRFNKVAGPVSHHKYDPVELYLTLLFSWNGWDHLAEHRKSATNGDEVYALGHDLDSWDRLPILPAGHVDLDPLLLQETPHRSTATTPLELPSFRRWAAEIGDRSQGLDDKELQRFTDRLLTVESRGHALAQQALAFRAIRSGLHTEIGPPIEDQVRWIPLYFLISAEEGWSRPPYTSTQIETVRNGFLGARKAFLAGDAVAFEKHSQEFAKVMAELDEGFHERRLEQQAEDRARMQAKVSAAGLDIFDFLDRDRDWDPFPTPEMVDREIFYNTFQPFWKSAIAAFIASLVLAASLGIRGRIVYGIGMLALLGSIGLTILGLYLRITISNRAPVTNMFETIIWASLVSSVIGVVLSGIFRKPVLALSAAMLLAMSNTIAVNMPADMGASIRPLEPVLRVQKWLIIHVMTIVASYGAFMLAWLLSLIGLAHYFRPNPNKKTTKELALFVYRAMQVGVVLLFAGTALGGWWAADSWGRFWGWDAKEVWALIALLTYLLVLHARHVGLKTFGTLAGSALAFTMVVGSWYGVNFLFPAGLHAYAINSGGQIYVISAVVANVSYVAIAWLLKSLYETRPATLTEPTTTSGGELT